MGCLSSKASGTESESEREKRGTVGSTSVDLMYNSSQNGDPRRRLTIASLDSIELTSNPDDETLHRRSFLGGNEPGVIPLDDGMSKKEAFTSKAGDVKIGCISRPGNDPLKRRKENQDCSFVHEHEIDGDGELLLGVFDGHGPNGAYVSHFVRDHFPDIFLSAKSASNGNCDEALTQATRMTAKKLEESKIDIFLSGTTGVIASKRQDDLWIGNVGDSRCVIGRLDDKRNLKAHELSEDHKPGTVKRLFTWAVVAGLKADLIACISIWRKVTDERAALFLHIDVDGERQRIVAAGGRVFVWGVPRVWLKDKDLPGLAMSRSFGDAAAKSVGVVAEAEVRRWKVTTNDLMLVLATDGIWEFMHSQEVIDFLKPYALAEPQKDPQEACRDLVEEAVKRWRREEDVVDDITAIVVFFKRSKG